MASTSEWYHFYQNNNTTTDATTTNNNNGPSNIGQMAQPYIATSSPPEVFFSGLISESTAVSTQMGSTGRVNKPGRRRTRASRRTPTTLLNTDTTNFRAMVQQYTGGPSNKSSPPAPVSNLVPHGFNIGSSLGYGLQYPMGPMQYGNATMSRNIISDAYFSGGSNVNNNNHVNVNGSSSSENRGSNNSFRF